MSGYRIYRIGGTSWAELRSGGTTPNEAMDRAEEFLRRRGLRPTRGQWRPSPHSRTGLLGYHVYRIRFALEQEAGNVQLG